MVNVVSPNHVRLADPAEVGRVLAGLRPRGCDFTILEIATVAIARPVLPLLPESQLLLAGVSPGPMLRCALDEFWLNEPEAMTLSRYLGDRFPPVTPVPAIDPRWLGPVRQIALGEPGQPVQHGLFPSTPTKLARLALARTTAYSAGLVRRAAAEAYSRYRSNLRRYYAGHDAFACALVHPDVDAGPLVERYARYTNRDKGHRARHKIHTLISWARLNGYVSPAGATTEPGGTPCPCGHDGHETPRTKQAALALAHHRDTIEPLLVLVDRAPDKQLDILECAHCGRFWAGDNLMSGHMNLSFVYPVETDYPAGWLRQANSLGW